MSTKKEKDVKIIELKPINKKSLNIHIYGETPFICHAFSDSVRKAIAGGQGEKEGKVTKKPPREPQKEFRESLYWLDKNGSLIVPGEDVNKHKTGFGIKADAFKQAAVGACRNIDNLPMTIARMAFHVLGGFIPLMNGKKYAVPVMRTDPVVIGKGTSSLAYRGMFFPWECNLNIIYNAGVITAEQVYNLMNLAGFACGVGDWRPNSPKKAGTFGMFKVK